MPHIISIELDNEVAKRLVERLELLPMPPVDQADHDAYLLKVAIIDALDMDDAEDA